MFSIMAFPWRLEVGNRGCTSAPDPAHSVSSLQAPAQGTAAHLELRPVQPAVLVGAPAGVEKVAAREGSVTSLESWI